MENDKASPARSQPGWSDQRGREPARQRQRLEAGRGMSLTQLPLILTTKYLVLRVLEQLFEYVPRLPSCHDIPRQGPQGLTGPTKKRREQ